MEKEPFDIEAALQKVDALCQGQGERVERVEGKLERHDDLLSSMVLLLTRLERTQQQHSKKFEQLDAKIDLRFEQLQSDFGAFQEVLMEHRQRIQACEQRASPAVHRSNSGNHRSAEAGCARLPANAEPVFR